MGGKHIVHTQIYKFSLLKRDTRRKTSPRCLKLSLLIVLCNQDTKIERKEKEQETECSTSSTPMLVETSPTLIVSLTNFHGLEQFFGLNTIQTPS